jgi:hypothetical protein
MDSHFQKKSFVTIELNRISDDRPLRLESFSRGGVLQAKDIL